MHLEGSDILKAPRNRVWSFLSDPKQIAQCLPDLQSLEVKDSKTFSVTVKVGISFVRGILKFDFTLIDQNPPTHSKFQAVGKGAGVSVHLTSSMDLGEIDANSTELIWKTDATLGGLLGELSPSLIQGSTAKFTQAFFECIKKTLESQNVP